MDTHTLSDAQLLSQLVGFDTTTRLSPKPLMDFVCNYLDEPGIRITRFECGQGYENLWCETGPESRSGEGVTLCGHVDTVPAEEPDWEAPEGCGKASNPSLALLTRPKGGLGPLQTSFFL